MQESISGMNLITGKKLFANSNYKTDINVPRDIQYVKGFDAKGRDY